MFRGFLTTFAIIGALGSRAEADSYSAPLTKSRQFSEAAVVLVGTFELPKLSPKGLKQSTTEFYIDEILKPHELLTEKKLIVLPRYAFDLPGKYVIFGEVYKGKLDYYRRDFIAADSVMVQYLKDVIAVRSKSQADRLRFYFDYLNSQEKRIAFDAHKEFEQADYKDFVATAKNLPKATLVAWINDPATPSERLDAFGFLLGHCGGSAEAELLKKALRNSKAKIGGDGFMAGLVMLEPADGWTTISECMLDPKESFSWRYCAFRTARALWESNGEAGAVHNFDAPGESFYTTFRWKPRPDLVSKVAIVKSMGELIQSEDMADFAIDELRKWKRWEYTQPTLELWSKESHNIPLIKKSIARFMLRSPDPAAAAFITEQRGRDPEWVKDREDSLSLESR